jgi:anti-sigma regulatory factor (Ser/Thr protein kinase)
MTAADGIPFQKTWRLAADVSELGRLNVALEQLVADGWLAGRVAQKFDLMLDELLTNVVRHGVSGVPEPVVEVTLCAHGSGEPARLTICDNGPPFDPLTQAAAPDLEALLEDRPIGGLGVHLVRTMADDLRYRRIDGRNELTVWVGGKAAADPA